jgi:hypothetical protein
MRENQMLPTARDPCNVQETVCNGPFNLAISGNLAFLTFTSVRPDPQEMMYGTGQPNLSAIITARLVLPVEMLKEIRNVIDQTLANQTTPADRHN